MNFADGHSEIHKWVDSRTTPVLKRGVELTLNVSSANNRDIIWLQERTTSPARRVRLGSGSERELLLRTLPG